MDRPLDLEELDLTEEALYAKRRAEFDSWFVRPNVCLYEAVMLSVRIIPQSYYRLAVRRTPASHRPRYWKEFSFRLDRADFHDRMVLALVAIRKGALSVTHRHFVDESEYHITLAEFERWANRENLPLPSEWRRKAKSSTGVVLKPQQVREQNNRLRIIRALIRAAKISDEATLGDVVTRARLLSPVESGIVKGVFHAVGWEDKSPSKRSSEEKKAMRDWPDNGDLIRIIAALISLRKLKIPKKGGPKRIDRLIYDDLLARGDPNASAPKIDTIEGVLKEARDALSDSGEADPS